MCPGRRRNCGNVQRRFRVQPPTYPVCVQLQLQRPILRRPAQYWLQDTFPQLLSTLYKQPVAQVCATNTLNGSQFSELRAAATGERADTTTAAGEVAPATSPAVRADNLSDRWL